jgi:hypothetical protein
MVNKEKQRNGAGEVVGFPIPGEAEADQEKPKARRSWQVAEGLDEVGAAIVEIVDLHFSEIVSTLRTRLSNLVPCEAVVIRAPSGFLTFDGPQTLPHLPEGSLFDLAHALSCQGKPNRDFGQGHSTTLRRLKRTRLNDHGSVNLGRLRTAPIAPLLGQIESAHRIQARAG